MSAWDTMMMPVRGVGMGINAVRQGASRVAQPASAWSQRLLQGLGMAPSPAQTQDQGYMNQMAAGPAANQTGASPAPIDQGYMNALASGALQNQPSSGPQQPTGWSQGISTPAMQVAMMPLQQAPAQAPTLGPMATGPQRQWQPRQTFVRNGRIYRM